GGRDGRDVDDLSFAEPHNRSLAELLLNIGYCQVNRAIALIAFICHILSVIPFFLTGGVSRVNYIIGAGSPLIFFSRRRTEKKAPVSPVPLGPSGCNWQASLGVML